VEDIGTMLLGCAGSFLPMSVYHVYRSVFIPSNGRIAKERVFITKAKVLGNGEEPEMAARKSVIAASYRKQLSAEEIISAEDRIILEDGEHGYAFTDDCEDRLGLYTGKEIKESDVQVA